MTCNIARDKSNEVQVVYASNNKESILWKDLLGSVKTQLPTLSIKEQKKIAIDRYLLIFNTSFQKKLNWKKQPDLNRESLDSNNEPTLSSYNNVINPSSNTNNDVSNNNNISNSDTIDQDNNFDYIADMQKKAQDIELNETSPEDTFYSKAGAIYERLTHWVHKEISALASKFQYSTPEESKARRLFKYKDIEKDVVNYDGEEYTYPQLLEVLRQEFNGYKYKGKIIHATIEKYLTKDKDKVNEIQSQIDKYFNESNLEPSNFRYLNDTYIQNLLHSKLGINTEGGKFADRIAPEVAITSDIFGIGTTIDGLIQHSDGSVSLIDFKSGSRFLSDEFIDEFMEYGIRNNTNIRDNSIDRAKIELTLRAMMLKEQYPDIKIRNVQLAHLTYDITQTRIINVDLNEFIPWMKEYLEFNPDKLTQSSKKEKDQQKVNDKLNKAKRLSDIYIKANNKGLFNVNTYSTTSKSVIEDTDIQSMLDKNSSKQDVIEFLKAKLEQLTTYRDANYKNLKDTTQFVNLERQIQKTLSQINDIDKNEFESIDIQDFDDMGWMKKNFGNLYGIKNPLVQKVIRTIGSTMHDANKIINGKIAEIDIIEKKLIKEYHEHNNTTEFQNIGLSQKKLWSFMTEQKYASIRMGDDNLKKEVFGQFRKVITEDEVKNGGYTQTEYEYNRLVNEIFEERAKELEKVAYIDDDGKAVSKAELRGIDLEHFRNSYMPRVAITESEVLENIGAAKYFTRLWKAKIREFFKNQVANRNPHLIPIKYLESEYHFSNPESYSNRWSYIMRESYKNLIYEEKLGSGFAYAKATEKFLQVDRTALDPKTGLTKFKNTIEWLEGWTKMMLVSDTQEILYSSKPIYINILGKKRALNLDRFVQGMDNFVTMNAMWFKPVSGLFNGFLNVLLTSQKAVSSVFAKWAGVKTQELSMKEFLLGNQHYLQSTLFSVKNNKLYETTESKDKMEFFLDYFGFDSNKFSYTTSTTDLNDAKLAIANKSIPFVFHQMGEGYSQIVLLASQLEQLKTTRNGEEISMWDAFDFNKDSNTFKYNGDVRFLDHLGNAITEPTYEEIAKMKRTYERIHGGYKSEEKMLIEMTAIGRWIVKFRKFIPSQIFENLQGQYNDWSIGGWGTDIDPKTGEPILQPGETMVQWISRSNQGRIQLFTKWLQYSSGILRGDKRYAWENLNDYQKQQVISMATNIAYGLSIVVLASMLFNGEDPDKLKNKSSFRRIMRLKEDMMPLNPFAFVTYAAGGVYGTVPTDDLLRTSAQPLLQPTQLYNLTKASWNFFFDGVIMGETIKTGPNKGNLKGSTQFKKAVPLISSVQQVITASQDFDFFSKQVTTPEEQSWLDRNTESLGR